MEHRHESDSDGATKLKTNIVLIIFLIIGAFFLVTEHRAPLFGWFPYWPYWLLLACLFMHLFMHGGYVHGGHGSSGVLDESAKEKK